MSRLRVTLVLVALAVIVGGAVIASRRGEDCALRDRLRIEGPAELMGTPEGVSVIVSSEEGFTVGALVWLLRIGDTEFGLSRYPDSSTDRIEFLIPDDALPRLHDGDGVGMRYGNPLPRSPSSSGAWSPAAANTVGSEGFGTLRVLDDCSTG
jgi:hypothetical protein